MFVYGGMDPSSSLILSDLWAFDLFNNTWIALSAPSYSIENIGFSPPSLFRARLIPTDLNCVTSTSSSPSCGLLVYGGLGGSKLQTNLGQVYKIVVNFQAYATQNLETAVSAASYSTVTGVSAQKSYIYNDSWVFARLTDVTSDRGRRRKMYALEEIGYSSSRRMIFEFGGLQAVQGTSIESDKQDSTGLYTPISLDAGGYLGGKIWDISTGENLRTNVDILTNGPWNFTNAIFKDLTYLREFRQYRFDAFDITLLQINK